MNLKIKLNGEVYVNATSHNPSCDVLIVNADYYIKDGMLIIEGDKINYELIIPKVWVDVGSYHNEDVKWGHKRLIDKLLNTQLPYVEGWTELVKRTPVKITLSHFILIESTNINCGI